VPNGFTQVNARRWLVAPIASAKIAAVTEWALVFVALAILAVAAVSRRLSGTILTPAMVLVAIGVLLGPKVLGEVEPSSYGEPVRVLAEATLALVLFCDASRIKLGALRRQAGIPVRLLGIGLPLTIGLGALAATLFDSMTVGEVLVLGVVLAPTDAALGQVVVTEPRLPARIRQGLNVESGLNDGICVPLLFIVLAAADVESHVANGHHAVTIVLEEIGYGLLVVFAGRRDLIADSWLQVIPVTGAALAYGSAAALGGSGFIAAFVAGALFGALEQGDPARITRLAEEVGELLNGVTFLIFGAVLLGPALSQLSWRVVLYAVISLTVVRMLPVAIAMLGTGARWRTVAFLGWFGPRGLASIVFALIVVQRSDLPQTPTILVATYVTVGLSALLHGLSAAPLAHRYARWYEAHAPDNRPAMESGPAEHHRARRSFATSAPTQGA
jgi:NhaP-type Na+/H+ or K+/H+ antiporter